jgi:nucleotide-binding universal stress UspA family protein
MSDLPATILLATDGSEEAELALRTAVDLANMIDAELHVVTVALGYPSYGIRTPEVVEQLREQAEAILDEQSEKIRKTGGTVAQAHLRVSVRYRAEQIVQVAEDIGAGLIVMGRLGLGGVWRPLVGSVSDSVIRHAPCAVMVVRQKKEQATYRLRG